MCGLTGCVFNNVINFDHKQFKKINDLISHRGPDYKDTSFFKSADKNVYFGHNRLSIIDLNKTGNQPMESQNNRFTIIFNGEIYNHKELRDFLIRNYNIIFKGTSDTEILLEYLSDKTSGLVFLLWGDHSRSKKKFIDCEKHHILECVHPSPLSANRGGWFGNKHFSKCNNLLKEMGKTEIDWKLIGN